MLVILGNWMLLNLFLAILLKALSKEPVSVPEEVEQTPKVEVAGEATQQQDQVVMEDASNNLGQEPSAALDSSNSNIEAEFEIIKRELEKISRGLHLNGNHLDHSADEAAHDHEDVINESIIS